MMAIPTKVGRWRDRGCCGYASGCDVSVTAAMDVALKVATIAAVALGASTVSLVARSARRASASQSGAMAMGRCTMSCDMPRSSSETRAHRMYCCGMRTWRGSGLGLGVRLGFRG